MKCNVVDVGDITEEPIASTCDEVSASTLMTEPAGYPEIRWYLLPSKNTTHNVTTT